MARKLVTESERQTGTHKYTDRKILKQEMDRRIGKRASVRKKIERFRVTQRQKERERNTVRIL